MNAATPSDYTGRKFHLPVLVFGRPLGQTGFESPADRILWPSAAEADICSSRQWPWVGR